MIYTPNSVVKLLQNVDLKNDYKDTIRFSSEALQSAFFSSKVKTGFTFSELTFVRKTLTLEIPKNVDEVMNCNYLMYQNTEYGNKWFYGFITNVVWVSVGGCEITFEIDPMQTFQFDWVLKASFVEREHVFDDTIGAHLVEENLETGEIKDIAFRDVPTLNVQVIVIATTVDIAGDAIGGGKISNIYSGLGFYAYENNSTGIALVNTFISTLSGLAKIDAIQSIFMMPKVMIAGYVSGDRITGNTGTLTDYFFAPYVNIDGYVPRNNKLFIYPYNFLYITNYAGGNTILKYEYSQATIGEDVVIKLLFAGDIAIDAGVKMIPQDYKGISNQYDEGLLLNNYPQCSFQNDNYKNWLAQNRVSNAMQGLSAIGALGIGVLTANPIATVAGVSQVAGVIGQFDKQKLVPPQARGNKGGNINTTLGLQTFAYHTKQITAEFAKQIDDYFHIYGYKINRLKVPTILTRKQHNYVKVINPAIFGNIPHMYLEIICANFEKGITFWHVATNIGNYTLDNSPLGS